MNANERIALNLVKKHFDELSIEQIAEACELDIEVVQKMLNAYQTELMQHNTLVQTLFGFINNENFDGAQETLDMLRIQKIKRDENVDFAKAEKILKELHKRQYCENN